MSVSFLKERCQNQEEDTRNCRILAEGKMADNDTRKTGLNNNDLIIGSSGSGKTRSYVKPNILQCNESIIVADTKNVLYEETAPVLQKRGYEVWLLDLADMEHSPVGYNPLAAVRHDGLYDEYNDQDISAVAMAICPNESAKEPFWDYAARLQMEALIAYVLEALPREEQDLASVARLQGVMHRDFFDTLFIELEEARPDSIAVNRWRLFANTKNADKTNDCIRLMLGERLHPFVSRGAKKLMRHEKQIDFRQMAEKKTALFINISDMDRAQDKLLNLIYTQALQTLARYADRECRGHRLPVPVRLILDDFASNAVIPDFDKIISVIRSREISVSIMIQSLSQLYSMYEKNRAQTIVNNCDHLLYLGGQDVETAEYIGAKLDRPAYMILNMPIEEAILFARGQCPCKVHKYGAGRGREENKIRACGRERGV